MQLTRFTDLGLRIVMRLAVEGPNAQLHTDDLAAQLCVSYTHATKVVARLSEMGAIESTRGRHGGVCITQDGLGRRVGSLARKLERSGEVIDCEGSRPVLSAGIVVFVRRFAPPKMRSSLTSISGRWPK